jgi:long-chain fatty acid transport protein
VSAPKSASLALALAFALAPSSAHAAGLGRPNVGGARAVGMGGAFTAVADDPSAVWFNPAGTAFYGDNVVLLGGELVILDRAYSPSANSTLGAAGVSGYIHENTAPQFTPVLGITTRFGFGKQPPTRWALSLAVYSPYGGAISFKPSDIKNIGISSTTIADVEISPTLAYQVTDVLSIGAGLRIGVGLFNVDDTTTTFHAKTSANGVGVGGVLGVMVRPHWRVQIGAVYRTPLGITMKGSGPLTIGVQPAMNASSSVSITWPQSFGLGVAVWPHRRLQVSVQGDWTGWSSVQRLDVSIGTLPAQTSWMRYKDTYALHLGLQAFFTRFLVGRVGYTFDGNAIDARDMRRENEDANKHTLGFGLGLHFWKLFIDLAFEALLPTTPRTINNEVFSPLPTPNNGPENEPGKYDSRVYSLELGLQFRF